MRISIFLILILIFLSGFFISCRYSLAKISIEEIEDLIESGNSSGKRCKKIKKRMSEFLTICQIAVIICLLSMGFVINDISKMVLHEYNIENIYIKILIIISFVVLICIIELVFGFNVPKFKAINNPKKMLSRDSNLLRLVSIILKPIYFIINQESKIINKLLGYDELKTEDLGELDKEVFMLIEEKKSENSNDNTNRLMNNIFSFQEKQIREVLIPRTDMVCINIDDDEEYIFDLIIKEGYTRYPVCGENKDDLLGFIHIRDLYNQKLIEGKINVKEILRELTYVSESEFTSKVLEKLRKHKVQVAIVVDEYGGTSGIITLEDIIEEIVGEIQDEFDMDEDIDIQKLDEDCYIVLGTTTIKDINRILGIKIEKEGFDSIGGWISYMLDIDIQEGQSIDFEGYRFEVLKLEKFRVVNLKIQKIKSLNK